jgi:DnaJ-class molecular chaperone
MDHYQLLGVPKNCDRSMLHRAFRELSKKHHPDRFAEDQRTEAERRYQGIVVAFNTLKDPKLRAQYDRRLQHNPQYGQSSRGREDPATMARKYFETGNQRFEAGQFEPAVEAYRRAVHLKADPEYLYRQACAESKVNRLHRDSVAHFESAIKARPRTLKYHLGYLEALRAFGLNHRARQVLETAVGLFPGNEDLLAIGRELDPKKYKQGFLGGIFGK